MEFKPSFGSDQQSSARKPLILAVDDDEDSLFLITQVLLELFDCSIITAVNDQTTLSLAQNYQPDLILLDILLPDLSGIEVVRLLKQDPQTQSIPVIAVTVLARAEDQERISLAGFDDYISKPYAFDNLEATIRHHLRGMPPP